MRLSTLYNNVPDSMKLDMKLAIIFQLRYTARDKKGKYELIICIKKRRNREKGLPVDV